MFKIYPLVTEGFRHRRDPRRAHAISPPVLISTGLPRHGRQCSNVVPGTNTKGRKRFRLVFSPQAPIFQLIFSGGPKAPVFPISAVKGEAAHMAAKILVTPGRAEARCGENRLHILCLASPDLHQHIAARRQMFGGS